MAEMNQELPGSCSWLLNLDQSYRSCSTHCIATLRGAAQEANCLGPAASSAKRSCVCARAHKGRSQK